MSGCCGQRYDSVLCTLLCVFSCGFVHGTLGGASSLISPPAVQIIIQHACALVIIVCVDGVDTFVARIEKALVQGLGNVSLRLAYVLFERTGCCLRVIPQIGHQTLLCTFDRYGREVTIYQLENPKLSAYCVFQVSSRF